RRSRPTELLRIARQPNAGELPAFLRLEKVAIGAANMRARRSAGATPHDVLVAHELSVVFAERPGSGAITGIRRIGAAGPFPNIAKHLMKVSRLRGSRSWSRMKRFVLDKISFNQRIGSCALPFKLGWEASARPIRIRIGFEITHVRHWLEFSDGTKTGKSKIPPAAIAFHPVKRRLPALFVNGHPTQR